jgi:hypothetical protein
MQFDITQESSSVVFPCGLMVNSWPTHRPPLSHPISKLNRFQFHFNTAACARTPLSLHVLSRAPRRRTAAAPTRRIHRLKNTRSSPRDSLCDFCFQLPRICTAASPAPPPPPQPRHCLASSYPLSLFNCRMKARDAPVNRWKSGSQGFGRSWHAGAAVPPPRRKTGGDEDAFA